ncbi:MAG: hypothetical protein KatS3mg010_0112 [Acidimicrobiia bacterium]|nr:MAG: hypothetical protein KatS3mg010_0112 [Acidimicrobiia bacterium]
MIPLADAQAAVLAPVAPLPPARFALGDAHGLVLAEVVTATEPVPAVLEHGGRRVRGTRR